MLDSVIEFLLTYAKYSYPVLFFGSLLETFFPPYPSDGVYAFCAFLSGKNIISSRLIFPLVNAGNYLGIMAVFFLGKRKVRPFFNRRCYKEETLAKTDDWFKRYGTKVILLNRFIPGIRGPLCFSAGVCNYSTTKMAIYAGISVLLWNGFLFYIYSYFGKNFGDIKLFLIRYNYFAVAITLVSIVVFILWRRHEKLHKKV